MIDDLLFQNNDESNKNQRDKRIVSFARTLNDAFKQFQNLWDDHKELLEKYKEVVRNFSNVPNEDSILKCRQYTTAEKTNNISKNATLAVVEEENKDCDPIQVTNNLDNIESREPECVSQDLSTQSSDNSCINDITVQNVTPKRNRSRSPVIGSIKGKTKIVSSPVSSPNLSEKSVVIINDFDSKRGSNIENRSISNISISNNGVTPKKAISNPVLYSPTTEMLTTPTQKSIKKWGLSTIHNVNTDIIMGTNKKLKQSKLLVKTTKLTDLSFCDDVCVSKSKNQDETTNSKTPGSINDNSTFIEINDNYLEDSVIQRSPECRKHLSKIRHKTSRQKKSAEKLRQKCNMNRKGVEDSHTNFQIGENIMNTDTDTDMTMFNPKITSTQHTHPPFGSKTLPVGKSLIEDKHILKERMNIPNKEASDSEVVDETMFDGNLVLLNSRESQRESSFKKDAKRKKLSLRKTSNIHKNPEVIQKDEDENYTSFHLLSRSEALQAVSPPRKKIALSNFDAPPKKKNTSPTYAYQRDPVRKKADRALLDGWSCNECEKYYTGIAGDLTEEELQKRKNECSRHRSKFNENALSQKEVRYVELGYWDPEFLNSYHSTIGSSN